MFRLLLILFLFAAVSCGSQKQVFRQYSGKPVSALQEEFGAPKTVLDKENEKIYIFEIVKKLESTEISQGKLTLDPIITPVVNKTERYYFTVKNGIVVKAKVEEEYER